jgi:NAD(P)H-dependent FMN reductase
MKPRILVIAGSRRKASFNGRLARLGAAAVEKAGGAATLLSLDEYPLPIYDGDVEADTGIPQAAMQLKEIFKSHSGLLIASPEYNASVAPLLKNTIDWVSRATPTENGKVPYQGKVVALVAASPSPVRQPRSRASAADPERAGSLGHARPARRAWRGQGVQRGRFVGRRVAAGAARVHRRVPGPSGGTHRGGDWPAVQPSRTVNLGREHQKSSR